MKELVYRIEGKCYICGRTPESFKNDFGMTEFEKQLNEFKDQQIRESLKLRDNLMQKILKRLEEIYEESKTYSKELTMEEIHDQIDTLKKIYPRIQEFVKFQLVEKTERYYDRNLRGDREKKIYEPATIEDIQNQLQDCIKLLRENKVHPKLEQLDIGTFTNLNVLNYMLEYWSHHKDDRMLGTQGFTGTFSNYKKEYKINTAGGIVYPQYSDRYSRGPNMLGNGYNHHSGVYKLNNKGEVCEVEYVYDDGYISEKMDEKDPEIVLMKYKPDQDLKDEVLVPLDCCLKVKLIVELCPMCAHINASASNASFQIYEEQRKKEEDAKNFD